ncbi:mucin-2 [Oncorhynchus keta]|uniref:mucin-2 n=1 Tax=Oncorhynchus keta TaxID=8018 RepID=UPI00227D6A15|nr:mucin-2 [Oncorhynchus keta]
MAHSAAGLQTASEDECPICRSTPTDPHHPAACSHVFCRPCLTYSLMWLPHCPVCRAEAQVDDIRPVRVKTGTMVVRLGQPLPGLSGLSTPATRSVAGDVQSYIRLLQMGTQIEGRSLANQTSAVTTAPPLPTPRHLHRPLSFSITPPAPTNDVDLYMSMTRRPAPTLTPTAGTTAPTSQLATPPTIRSTTPPTITCPATTNGLYMTMAQTPAPTVTLTGATTTPAPTTTTTIPAITLTPTITSKPTPTPRTRALSAPGRQPLAIPQRTPSAAQRPNSMPSTSNPAPPVLAAPPSLSFTDDGDLYENLLGLQGQLVSSVVRMTFVCPFCQESCLDARDLWIHCNGKHYYDNRPVVCPVCVSLPHGNPHQISRNFIMHLNLRHCYYAEKYTNTHQTDMLNLQDGINESLQDTNLNPR